MSQTKPFTDPNHEHLYFRLIWCGHGLGHTGSATREALNCLMSWSSFQPTHDRFSSNGDSVTKSTHLFMGNKQISIMSLHKRLHVVASSKVVFPLVFRYIMVRHSTCALIDDIDTVHRPFLQAHPDECRHMFPYDDTHPSARHSDLDWSTWGASTFPDDFSINAKGSEVVLQAGPVFAHLLVSLHCLFGAQLSM